MVGIASVLSFLYPTANPLLDYTVVFDGTNDHVTQWNTGSLGAQPSDASLAVTQASAPYLTYIGAPAVLQRSRDIAAGLIASDSGQRAIRAAAAVLVDEINAVRQWTVSLKAAVAGASSLATLQTAVAALPTLSDRTLAQAKTAIQNKISSGAAD